MIQFLSFISPPLSFLSLRSNDEMDQVFWKFPQGLPATHETVDNIHKLRESCCYVHGIEVLCVLCNPFGGDVLQWEGFMRLVSRSLAYKADRRIGMSELTIQSSKVLSFG